MLLLLLTVSVVGCAAKRDNYDVPEVLLPEQFKYADSAATVDTPLDFKSLAEGDEPLLSLDQGLPRWWQVFASDELNELVELTLTRNHDLRINTLKVTQDWLRYRQSRGGELPKITLPLQAKIEAPDDGIGSVPPGGEVHSRTLYQASLRGDWRVDLWGELRSLSEAAEFRMWRSIFNHDAVQIEILATVVDAYIEYLTINDRLRVARDSERVMDEMLAAVDQRLSGGDATLIDLEQQRAATHSVKAVLPELELQREEALHRLAQLSGGIPKDFELAELGLDSLSFPEVIPGLPAALLLRRPDVRQVEAELLAADADIDVARARILPPLDLTAQIGYGSRHLAQLFSPHTLFWNAIGNLSATIFDGGRLRRERDFAVARHEELVETYYRTIYNAVREVEDALVAIELTGRRLEILNRSVEASRRAMLHSREAYEYGAVDYLTLLYNINTHHNKLDEYLRVRQERQRAMVRLLRALGGGAPNLLPLPDGGKRPEAVPESAGGVMAVLSALQPRTVFSVSDNLEPFLADLSMPRVHGGVGQMPEESAVSQAGDYISSHYSITSTTPSSVNSEPESGLGSASTSDLVSSSASGSVLVSGSNSDSETSLDGGARATDTEDSVDGLLRQRLREANSIRDHTSYPFSIQFVLAVGMEGDLRAIRKLFAEASRLGLADKVHLYKSKDEPLWRALYGSYGTPAEVTVAIDQLPKGLLEFAPYPRQMTDNRKPKDPDNLAPEKESLANRQ